MNKQLDEDARNSEKYQSQAFPLRYHKFLIEKFRPQETFVIECLQKIYNSGRLSGNRLLDFGCGPSVYKVASASRQYNDIILADFSEPCRIEVEKWLRGDKDALDWTIPMEQCARAEGYRNLETGVAEIEKRIRGAVKKVIWCDALAKDVLPVGMGEFDAINSSRCFETCCGTTESYKEGIKNLTKHLKQGGVLVMTTALEARSNTNLTALYLTEEIIKESLSEVGLDLKDWFCWRDSGKHELFEYGGLCVYYAIKL